MIQIFSKTKLTQHIPPFYKQLPTVISSITMLMISAPAFSAPPNISPVADQTTQQGSRYHYSPTLSKVGSSPAATVNWSKAFGPDDVKVDPTNGTVTWNIPAELATESFHIGLRANNAEGSSIESWIVHVGVPEVIYIGPKDTYKTISSAFKKETQPGTTFVVRNGTYSGLENSISRRKTGVTQYPPAGSPGVFSTVMAQDPGEVTLNEGAYIEISGANGDYGYAAFKGFFVEGGSIGATGLDTTTNCKASENCRPHHLKFIRNGVKSDGRNPFDAFRSDHILFENNYAYGGGRYKFASYQSTKVVFRRNVARYDRSNNEMAEPKGTYSIYTTMDADISNNIAIDGDQPEFVTTGELAGEYTCPTTSGPSRARFYRNIQLNSDFMYGNIDRQVADCDAIIRNVLSWDVRPENVHVLTRSPSWFDHVTMGNIKARGAYAENLFNGWPNTSARGITNSVLHNIQNGDLFFGFTKENAISVLGSSVERFGVDTLNISNTPGKLNAKNSTLQEQTFSKENPLWSTTNSNGGLRYPIRIERNSTLSGKAKDGGDLGATIMTFKGKSGTLWGEPGFNEETNKPMWPFPFEETIKAKMASYRYTGTTYTGAALKRTVKGTGTISGNRGFATDNQTLSHYIWNYLGNTVPPFNVSAIPISKEAINIKWDIPHNVSRNSLKEFIVYQYEPTTSSVSNPKRVSAEISELTVKGLNKGSNHNFVVTAVDRLTGESSYSYPTLATPAPPKAPILTGKQVPKSSNSFSN